ncbi:hypothetical protein LY90DRAFT_511253 [Neocallimastix californiae]|uniref:S-adenosyl-L-methionine-dependent methyltransferase n=1 Tax=Neocallimastix californiae TaxID=1754190 RepID=A0A1Y2BRF0_9FUNG|nr:hypothetical protein LY90DRAFT_511253 [Neocallimastix californiae]|eukprot:ORY37322.1 hypothetical protein LY90DRAFT_511253 [Neocallimastix californiae]
MADVIYQNINTSEYLNIKSKPVHIKEQLEIKIVDNSFLPGAKDDDWFAHSALPALKLIEKEKPGEIKSFLSIGSGPGLDVLASAEVFGSKKLALTDLQENVVKSGVQNIKSNLLEPEKVEVNGYSGDLFEPLRSKENANENQRFDIIYENLPNVPIPEDEDINKSRSSTVFLEKRSEKIPGEVKEALLDLHYLAIQQVHEFLNKNGALISLISGVIPIDTIKSIEKYIDGVKIDILYYNWNIQTSFYSVINTYAKQEEQGYGPFIFYKENDLKKAFEGVNDNESGKKALDIEKSLVDKRLTATEALKLLNQGENVGYTITILKTTINDQ